MYLHKAILKIKIVNSTPISNIVMDNASIMLDGKMSMSGSNWFMNMNSHNKEDLLKYVSVYFIKYFKYIIIWYKNYYKYQNLKYLNRNSIRNQTNYSSKYKEYNNFKRMKMKRNSKTSHSRNYKNDNKTVAESIKSGNQNISNKSNILFSPSNNAFSIHQKENSRVLARRLKTRSTKRSMIFDSGVRNIKSPVNSKRIMHSFNRTHFSRDQYRALPPPPLGHTVGHGIMNSSSALSNLNLQFGVKSEIEIEIPVNKAFQNNISYNKMF